MSKTYTLLEAEGLYNDATELEKALRILRGSPQLPGGECNINLIASLNLSAPRNSSLVQRVTPAGPKMADLLPFGKLDLSEDVRRSIDGILTLKLAVTAADVSAFINLKTVVRMGVGVDLLDRPALQAMGCRVCNVPDYGTEEIADHAIAMTLALRRGLVAYQDLMREPQPIPWNYLELPIVSRLRGAVFGIVVSRSGYGRMH
jgi:phosphoglycerate dehydrogenase-like enzyme